MYQVIVYGSVWYESNNELLANAYAFSTMATGWKKVEVAKAWKRGKYTLTKREIGFKLDNGTNSDWPVRYEDGKFGFDNPEYWPPSIREWAKRIIERAEKGGK